MELLMDRNIAEQIAILINEQNELIKPYTTELIQKHSEEYQYKLDRHGDLVCCLRLKRVQWYQGELCHASSRQKERQNTAMYRILERTIQVALEKDIRLLQATVRASNIVPQKFLKSFGFEHTATFYYPVSGNDITVWQKNLSIAPNVSRLVSKKIIGR